MHINTWRRQSPRPEAGLTPDLGFMHVWNLPLIFLKRQFTQKRTCCHTRSPLVPNMIEFLRLNTKQEALRNVGNKQSLI